MKVLKKAPKRIWTIKRYCEGIGHGNHGCLAELLVEESDIYRTCDGLNTNATFMCPECGKENDIRDLSDEFLRKLPDKKEWENKK